jgi:hypothetical protein
VAHPIREVLAGIVDHVVGADGADQVYLGRAAHAGDLRAERLLTRVEPGHVGADCLHLPGDISAPDADLGAFAARSP